MPDGSSPPRPVDLIVSPEPFSPRVERLTATVGGTVAELLTEACRLGALNPQDLPYAEVWIDGERLIDRPAALDLRPSAGAVVNVAVLPQGGGGGGNKVLSTVVEIALIAATAWVSGPASAGALSLAGASGLSGAGLTAARFGAILATSVAGSALLQAINKPVTPDKTYDLESQSNGARRGQPMPLCLGGRRWSFDLASSAYSTFDGDDTYVTAIYALHYGPCQVEDIKIGETLLSAYPTDEYQVEYFLTPGPRTSQLYPTDIHQDSFQNALDRDYGTTVTETTVLDATSIQLDFYWASGLYFPKSDGRIYTSDTKIYIEISPAGANAWQAAPGLGGGVDKSGNSYPAGTYYVQASNKTPVRQTLNIALPTPGQYDVRIHRDTRSEDDVNNDAVTWTAMRTPRPGEPVLDQTLSIIVLRAKASQDFSGTLGVVSGVVTPIVPIWSDGNWSTTAASSNPAALDRWLYTGPAAAKPLTDDEIDGSYGAQYELIEDQNWDASVLVTDQSSQQDVSKKLGAAGRYTSYWNGSRMCLVPSWVKDAPRQLFVGRNASGFRRTRMFPDPIHAVYVTFVNADEDWKQDGLYVYADGYDDTNSTLIENQELDFACSAARAHKDGRNFLARRKDQVFSYQWTAGADALVSSLGDRVRARRTSALYDQTDGRVISRIWAGGLVSGVRIDAEFAMTEGQSYALDVRTPDAMLTGLDLAFNASRTRVLTFASPLAEDYAPGKGDLVSVGRVSHVTEDVEIIDIDPQTDRTVSIKAVNYIGDALVAAETGAIPTITTFLTARESAPTPRILSANGSPDGVLVGFEIEAQRQTGVAGFTARWRITPTASEASTWSTLPQLGATARTAQTPPVPAAQHNAGDESGEVRVDFEIRTVMTSGELSDPASVTGILIYQGVLPVTGFDAEGEVRTGPDNTSYPVLAVKADAMLAGDVQDLVVEVQPTAASPEAWVSAGQPLPASNPVGDFAAVTGGSVIDVRARWRSVDGWYGDYVTATGVSIPGGQLIASDTRSVAGRLSTLILEQLDAAGTNVEAAVTAALAKFGDDAADQNAAAIAQLAQSVFDLAKRMTQLAPGALPMGAFLKQVQTSTDTSAESLNIIGARSDDGLLYVFNDSKVTFGDGTSLADYRSGVEADLGTITSTAASNFSALTTADAANASATALVQTNLNGLSSTVATNQTSNTSAIATNASAITALQSNYTSLSSTVSSNFTTFSNALTTEANARLTLASVVSALSSTVDFNNITQTTNLSTEATSRLALASDYNGFKSSATSQLTTLSNTTSTLAANVSTLFATASGLSATLTATGAALVDVQNKVATAYLSLMAAASGGTPTYVTLVSSSTGGAAALVSDKILLGNPSGDGSDVKAGLIIVDGQVYAPENIYVGDDASVQMRGPDKAFRVYDSGVLVCEMGLLT